MMRFQRKVLENPINAPTKKEKEISINTPIQKEKQHALKNNNIKSNIRVTGISLIEIINNNEIVGHPLNNIETDNRLLKY